MDTINRPQTPRRDTGPPTPDAPLIGWETPEFVQYQRSKKWFLIAILVFAILVVFALITKQWLMAAVIILSGVIVYIFTQQKPKTVPFAISHAGITFGNRFYPYNEIKSFWIIYEPRVKTINFEMTRRLSTIITVQLLEQDPLPIRKFLKKYIPEEKSRGEEFSDRISRLLRF